MCPPKPVGLNASELDGVVSRSGEGLFSPVLNSQSRCQFASPEKLRKLEFKWRIPSEAIYAEPWHSLNIGGPKGCIGGSGVAGGCASVFSLSANLCHPSDPYRPSQGNQICVRTNRTHQLVNLPHMLTGVDQCLFSLHEVAVEGA